MFYVFLIKQSGFIFLTIKKTIFNKGEVFLDERDYKEYRRDLDSIAVKARELSSSIGIDSMKDQLLKFEEENMNSNLWQDKEKYTFVNREISRLKKKILPFDNLIHQIEESIELYDLSMQEKDFGMLEEIYRNIPKFNKTFDDLETIELLSGEDDENNAFVTIHAGAGGTESQDWASMLFRMLTRWSEKKGFEVEILDYSSGEEAGIKSATILVKGDFSYGLLKGEQGVHRLVRISPFDSNKRRHTSFASVEVLPEVSEEVDVEINENDLRIDTYRASGAGGQHVNKTDSAIRITHIPTNIVVQCQNERSQHKNKATAMKVLKSRLYDFKKKEMDAAKLEKQAEKKDISWGNQIRSYVFQPYTMVKDHRTGEETASIDFVFDGDIDRFIYSYLKSLRLGKT